MRERPTARFRPAVEWLEAKQPLAAGVTAAPLAHPKAGVSTRVQPPAPSASRDVPSIGHGGTISATAKKPNFGYLVFRITNPTAATRGLAPPFGHVLVQDRRPVPGQHYNILLVAMKNATNQTFDASSGFKVRLPYQHYFPILTGNEQWKPGQDFIFYVLSKKYYPLPNQVSSGFQFNLGGAWSTAIPGPSGIFLRVKYDPATIDKILDYAVTRGPGAQGGAGIKFGIPDTAIYAFVPATQNRNDFGGYF